MRAKYLILTILACVFGCLWLALDSLSPWWIAAELLFVTIGFVVMGKYAPDDMIRL